MKKDNRGLSLVELLVAITIAAIVAGAIGYLIRTSLYFYGNETTDAALQQELQLTLNQIMDYSMESQEVVISGSDSATDMLVLGQIKPDESDSSKLNLDAQIIWKDADKLYLKKGLIKDIKKETDNGTLIATAQAEVSAASAAKENYLLAEYVSAFCVSASGLDTTNNNYINPVALDITIAFTKKGSSGDITKKVNDRAVLRNKVQYPIFVNGTKYTLKEETAEVETVTETVDAEVALSGDIHYVQAGEATKKTKLTVIEVIPKPRCSLLGYLVGGKEPIDEYGMDACANRFVGHTSAGPQMAEGNGSMNSNQQLLSFSEGYLGAGTIPNFLIGSGYYNGYFEKIILGDSHVRRGRGGVYAICKDDKITGYDNLYFISEYTTSTADYSKYEKGDFCWIWKEDSSISTQGYSSSGAIGDITSDFKLDEINGAPAGARIYMTGCRKKKVINNELFILYCMGYDQSNGKFGLCQGVGEQADPYILNRNELGKINKDNIEFLAYTPSELKDHHDDLERADLIFFLAGNSGIYDKANNLLNVEEPNSDSSAYQYTSDITFDEMRYIYNKVVNYKLGIVVSRPTYNNIKGKTGFQNLSNLFYMLYGMDNTNIVSDGDKVYGLDDNRYYLNDPQKVADIKAEKGAKACMWSGRMMFTDFFKTNVNDKSTYSYENQVTNKEFASSESKYYVSDYHGTNDYIRTDEFIHFKDENCASTESGNVGDIVIGNVFWYGNDSWYSNSFTQLDGQVFGNSATVKDNNKLVDRNGKKILDFLILDYYFKKGFQPVKNENNNITGVFANQAMIEDDGFIVQYNPYSSTGSLGWLGSVVTATNGTMANKTADKESIGTIEIVGYAVGHDGYDDHVDGKDGGRYNLPANYANMTYDECIAAGMTYQHQFETLANGKGKGLYMSYDELELSKVGDNGLYIYIVVRSTEDLYPVLDNKNENNPFVYYDINQDYTSEVQYKPPILSEIYCSESWNGGTPSFGEGIKYKAGTNSKGEVEYVTEFRAHIPGAYFRDTFKAPTNSGNNRMIARIGKGDNERIDNIVYPKTKLIAGSEIFYMAVRDDFDLD